MGYRKFVSFLIGFIQRRRYYVIKYPSPLLQKTEMNKNTSPSEQAQTEAMSIARATQKAGQTKEQTKLIAQGIAKGIAQYKKQQKERNRKADKAKKQAKREKAKTSSDLVMQQPSPTLNEDSNKFALLPWALLAISWAGFIAFWMSR